MVAVEGIEWGYNEENPVPLYFNDGSIEFPIRRGNKVLLMDDDELVLEMYKDACKIYGIDYEVAEDGLTGIQQILQNPNDYTAAVVDLDLPGEDGIEVIDLLADAGVFKNNPKFGLVFASGQVEKMETFNNWAR